MDSPVAVVDQRGMPRLLCEGSSYAAGAAGAVGAAGAGVVALI